MPVTVDDTPLLTQELGLSNMGQVLAHLRNQNRLVVHVLIDGQEPDLERLGDLRKVPIDGPCVYIETTNPKEMAQQITTEVRAQLSEADRLKSEAVDLLQKNQNAPAMQKLAGCFGTWHNSQQSVLGMAQLLKVDLDKIEVGGKALAAMMQEFSSQLRQIKNSLENRDFVSLSDYLLYETSQTSDNWRQAMDVLVKKAA